MEHRTPLTPYLVTKTCEKCGAGEIKATGDMFPVHPPLYEHRCTNAECGEIEKHRAAYPRVQFFLPDGRGI